jgi:hypothetical protein
MLPILQTTRTLMLTRPGRLQRWLGPALRGLVAGRFKARVCRQPLPERDTHWVYCQGCPLMAGCPYGETVEPDPPADAEVFRGQEDAARPVVIAPAFPVPEQAAPGLRIPLSVTFIGRSACQHAAAFWDAVGDAGADPAAGLDPDRTTFAVLDEAPDGGPLEQGWLPDLPLGPGALDGVVPLLRVELTSPLLLRTEGRNARKVALTEPSFADLLRASLRSLGQLYALYADVPPGQSRRLPADFAALREAAEQVPAVGLDYRPFRQPRHSNRTGQRVMLQGVVGSGVYADVPLALARWLRWGGRLHVGGHRVAGAGGWRLAWSEGPAAGWHPLS